MGEWVNGERRKEKAERKGATSASDRRGIKAAIKLTSMVFAFHVVLLMWPLLLCRGQNQSLS